MQVKNVRNLAEMVFVFGSAGCGKSTLVDEYSRISQDLFTHFEMSELLKESNDPDVLDCIERRVLVPDEVTFSLLKSRIVGAGFSKKGGVPQTQLMVVTGFPRSYQQVLCLDDLRRDLHPEIGIYAVEIKICPTRAKQRILARGRDGGDASPERVEKRIALEEQALRGVRCGLRKLIEKGVVINKFEFANDGDSIKPLIGTFEKFLGSIGALSYVSVDENMSMAI